MGQGDRFSTLSNALREPLMVVDERGLIVSSNDAASRMLATDDRGLVGMPLSAVVWGDDDGALDDLLRRGATTRAIAELCFGEPDGESASADVTVWPLEGEGEARTAVLVHDLSGREDNRERLSYQAAELEAQRAELRSQAEEASSHARQLKTALETRHRFYASMSHELRTPVNAIVGYSELLLDGIYGELTSAQSKILRRSLRAASHLQELVNDLLDLARIEEGRLDLQTERVDVAELVEGLLDSVGPLAHEHSITLRHEAQPGMPPLVSDPRRIRKILLHLLTNAIKYGGRGPVTIRSGRTSVGGGAHSDGVFIEVIDGGAGMAPDELEKIFSEFVRHRNDSEGTGLGLSIARGLSHALGGTLVAESAPGRGSTFRLTLPCGVSDGDTASNGSKSHVLPQKREARP
jgi:PAS domain S-box-containing protein